jgi:hypothetical protein
MTGAAAVANAREIAVLLACVRPPSSQAAEAGGLAGADLNWEFLLREARRHGVLPLFYHGIRRLGQAPPAPAMELLQEACRRSQRRNLALTAELLRIVDALAADGVPALPFKGPVLAVSAYGDLALRTFGDLDVLVHQRDLARAREALLAFGYRPEFALTARQDRAYCKAECALRFHHPERDVLLELHWLLTERYLSIALPVEELWTRLVPVRLAGRTMPAFAPEDLLLYLAVHGGKHRWERLEWVCSLAWVAAGRAIDWSEVCRRARASGTERLLRVGLLLAHDLLDLDPPDEIRGEIARDRAAALLAGEIAAGLFVPEAPARDANRGGWYLYLLRSRERWRDRARIVLFSSLRLPHPAGEELVALPSRLSFLYYVFRPIRMVGASLAAAWRHAARRIHSGRREHSEPVCTR